MAVGSFWAWRQLAGLQLTYLVVVTVVIPDVLGLFRRIGVVRSGVEPLLCAWYLLGSPERLRALCPASWVLRLHSAAQGMMIQHGHGGLAGAILVSSRQRPQSIFKR